MAGKKKILIIRMANIGDVIRATPLLRLLKTENSGASVDFLTSFGMNFIFDGNPYVDRVYNFDKVSRIIRKIYRKKSIKRLREQNYSDIYLLETDRDYVSFAIEIKGHSTKLHAYDAVGTQNDIDFAVSYDESKNVIERFLMLSDKKDFNSGDYRMDLCCGSDRSYYYGAVVLHCFTTETPPYRGWRFDDMAECISRLCSCGHRVVVTGLKKHYDELSLLKKKCACEFELFIDHTIVELCSLLRSAGLVVSADTGVFHMARAYQTPVVGIWGATTRGDSGALGPGKCTIINRGCELAPCFGKDQEYFGSHISCLDGSVTECMRDFPLDEAMKAIDKYL